MIAATLACAVMVSDTLIYQGSNYVMAAEKTEGNEETGEIPGEEEEEIDIAIEGLPITELFKDEILIQRLRQNDIDLNENGHLSRIELLTVRKLDVSGMEIRKLDGIENFTNLEELNCSNNLINTLDLSNNKKLVKLYCSNNRLVSLNLEKNIELQILDCSDNMIWELAIENCGKLKEIYCRNNLVESLGIEYAASLTTLDCGGNPNLSALNPSSNSELKELKCDGGIITSLNLRYNTKLETVNCENNRLVYLDLGGNNAMKYVDCSDNQLETLDLSSLDRLQTIDCSNNQIQSLDVKRSTALTSLDCRENKIQELDVTNNTRLTSLCCSNNELLYLDVTNNSALTAFLSDDNERIIESPIFDLNELEGIDLSKITELSNVVLEEGKLRFVNTSLPATYRYQVGEKQKVTFTLSTTGTFKSMATVNVEKIPDQLYQGREIIPQLTATYGSAILEEGKDYVAVFKNNVKAGTATVTLTGTGEYDGTIVKNFKIEPMDIGQTDIAPIENQVYTGLAIAPQLDITYNGAEVIYGTDYTVNYSNNYSIGEAKMEIIGKGNFKGTLNKYFYIEAKHIGRAAMKSIDNQIYNGSAITPEVVIEDGSNTLIEGTDYTFTYDNNINAGTAYINIVGMGNYGKESQETFIIEPKAINNLQVEDIPDTDYSGFEKRPGVSVYDNDIETALIENEDYTISYEDNVNAGTAKVIIHGIGNYKGQIEKSFRIRLRSGENVMVETIEDQEYTAREVKPEILVKDGNELLVEGKDYTLAYTGNVEVGTATVEIILQGNYEGILTTKFEIVPRNMDNVDATKVAQQYYSGTEITPEVTLSHDNSQLEEEKDFTVDYEENIEIGKGKIVITGKGNYNGTKIVSFDIVSRPIDMAEAFCTESFVYSGKENQPKPVIIYGDYVLVEDVDYQLSYSNNVNAGNGIINVKGIGNFCGQTKTAFEIRKKDISEWTIEKIQPKTYTKKEIVPELKIFDGEVELLAGKDFSYTVTNNIEVGTATVKLEAKGNYTGTKKEEFTIQPKDIKWVAVEKIPVQTYTGKAITPEVKVSDGTTELVLGKDYTVQYSNHTQRGIGKILISGKGNYNGSQQVTFEITGASIAQAVVEIRESAVYTGKAIAPSVKVSLGEEKLQLNQDYIVIYADNKEVGKATVTVEGIGNYKDKKLAYFTIFPRTAGIKKLSTKKNTITVSWKTKGEASGYIVEYARDKKFTKELKKKNVGNGKKASLKIKKLKKGKRYYVRVRSYKKVDGRRIYGKYSSIKSIKVK